MLHGMVFKKEAEGDVTSVKDAKIAVFSCPFDCMVTETKVMDAPSLESSDPQQMKSIELMFHVTKAVHPLTFYLI